VGRTPAAQLAPGVWRISTAPADLVNSFAFVNDDGQVTLVDTTTLAGGMTWPVEALCTDFAMTELRGFLRHKAAAK
jgi:hypothetical protein